MQSCHKKHPHNSPKVAHGFAGIEGFDEPVAYFEMVNPAQQQFLEAAISKQTQALPASG
ncbi:MAG: hypothetical protein H7293_13925 [Candidatus Saccharibacteria bacterium]|nr:hypothetical protein [Rhodoferax sp.]